jgi:15-cis-phytoene desaturase
MMMWLAGMGYELRDMALMGAKVWQYLTACRERRLDQYQRVSFWDFIEGEQYSGRFQRHIQRLIRVLVAMDARRADARTVLNVLVRMILDQNTSGAETDRVLNGPTSERWLAPWRHYLENHLGVRFHWRHTLQKFELDEAGRRIARAFVAGPDGPLPPLVADTDLASPDGVKYFVVDLPVRALERVLSDSPGLREADEREVRERPPRDFPRENPDPPLSSVALLAAPVANPRMSGIQFYLSDPLQILPGHVMFIDSAWGLSAVVQTQFWGDDFAHRYGEHTVRAILSVDLTDFETKGKTKQRSLNEIIDAVGAGTLTPAAASDEIAVEVWSQMAEGLRQWEIDFPRADAYVGAQSGETFPIPPPYVDHHIDAHLGFPCGGCPDAPLGRALGYFVSPPDTWGARPGPLPSYIDNERGYRIRLGNLAVAGVFAQTFTSLNSMEAANESARHATNGILNHAERHLLPHEDDKARAYRFEKCSIWPMEEAEPGDLVWWKQIDDRLWRKGDPHMLEILGTAGFVERFMKVCNVRNEANTPEKFHRLYEDLFAWISAFGRFSPF